MKKKVFIVLLSIFVYYQVDYKRYFIYSEDKTKVFTIWKRSGYNFYLIPGKYFSPFAPTQNYIYSSNQGFGVIFNPKDSFDYKIGIFYRKIASDFNPNIKVYKDHESLLFESKILDSIDNTFRRHYPKNVDSVMTILDYKFIDTERIYGIKIFD
jgi:hypothetical protein